ILVLPRSSCAFYLSRDLRVLPSFPTRRSSDLHSLADAARLGALFATGGAWAIVLAWAIKAVRPYGPVRQQTAYCFRLIAAYLERSEEHTSELQSLTNLVCRLLLAKRL